MKKNKYSPGDLNHSMTKDLDIDKALTTSHTVASTISDPAWKLAEAAKNPLLQIGKSYSRDAYNLVLQNVPKHLVVSNKVEQLIGPQAAWFLAVLDPVSVEMDSKYAYTVTAVQFGDGRLRSRIGIGITKQALMLLYHNVLGHIDQRAAEELFAAAGRELIEKWKVLHTAKSAFTLAINGFDCLLIGECKRNRAYVTAVIPPDMYNEQQQAFVKQIPPGSSALSIHTIHATRSWDT
ncbi:hypothetical protein [Variovorax sp. PCZ-1]|uniref:hypothetical protein n=1 Tax=Variovorax sp. PCZ-1 TaxID=2835533 RepID=UPI001BCC7903|nr:hypothetical protein [Variovorax sp. PCZ-1]MBS7807609.1 hypothetical protein [Variovorax sp. PCZ-1]